MTKPHTTLSEAVRALPLPQAAGVADFHVSAILDCRIEEPCYTEFQVRALIATIAALVEQHEAQEPAVCKHRIAGWKAGDKAGYHCTDCGEVFSAAPDPYGPAEPTLAATQAGDAWISVQDRMPSDESVVMAWNGDSIVFERWMERHESPVEWSSVTVPIGKAWDEHEFEEITHWMPLPPAPTTTRSE